MSAIRQADLGIERVYQADGVHYSYSIVDANDAPIDIVEGGQTWAYIGQAVFSDVVLRDESESIAPDFVLTGLEADAEGYLGVGTQTRVDQYGREWLLVDVDVAAVEESIAEYDAEVARLFGDLDVAADPGPGIEYLPYAGEPRSFLFDSVYYHGDCQGDSEDEYTTSSGSSWARVTTPDTITRTTVLIDSPAGWCSGVMVDDDWVLTAAHCAADEEGEFDESEFVVCTRGNLQTGATCKLVDAITVRFGHFTGNPEDDWAVLKLASHPANTGYLPITQASDAVLAEHTQYLLGYPVWGSASCTLQQVAPGFGSPVIVSGYRGSYEWQSEGPISNTSEAYLEFDMSAGGGESGGPYFYCPTDDCDDGAWITAIHSARHTTDWQAAGPRGTSFRTWVIANTP